jgi:NADPH:quinone reductase-like Zn-dependent oxidoreductase
MKTMKAIQIRQYKKPEEFALKEIPVPTLSAGEILVKVEYAGINPSDLANTQGYFPDHTVLPRVIGRDFVGEVVEGPKGLLGKTVMGSGGDIGFVRDGTFAEYIAVPETGAVEVPGGLDLTQAASLGVPFLAALACLNPFPKDLKGKNILLVGGAGAVGSATTVIARKRGGNVIRTILNQEEVESLAPELKDGVFMDLGKNPDIVSHTKELMRGGGFDFIINMVGGATFGPAIKSLNEYGMMSCIASPGQPAVELNLLDFYRRNLSLFGLNTVLDDVKASAMKLQMLLREFKDNVSALTYLGKTQIVSFDESQSVLTMALAKQLRKPVFKISA